MGGVSRRLLLLAIALVAAAPPSTSQMEPYLHAQRLVNIGSRNLNIYCTGSGSPTVVLDAGLGDTTKIWYKVQGPLSKRSRVCSYDRAGMGFSDGTTSRRDASSAVTDLHALLHRAGIEPPYVLVGHSIAGLYAPLYADRYTNEVAGMVLVDPTPPYVYRREAAVAPGVAAVAKGAQELGRRCYGDKASKDCLDDRGREHSTSYWYAFMSEADSAEDRDSAQAQEAQRKYGALPLIVLTAADGFDIPGIPKAQQIAAWSTWNAMHDELASSSSVGVNFVVRNSGHYIQLDQPAAVLSAVDEVVDQARARR